MKGGYDYGAGLQAQCDTVFMERERADFQANNTYNKTVQDQFKTAYSNLLSISVLIVMISYSLWIVVVLLSAFRENTSINTYLYNILVTRSWSPSSRLDKFIFILQQYLFPLAILGSLAYLLSIWIKGNFTKAGVKVGNETVHLSPFDDTVYNAGGKYKGGALLLRTHYKYLSMIFGVMLVGTMLYNPTITNSMFSSVTPISSTYTGHIFTLYVVLLIILPLFVDIIAGFQDANSTYNDTVKELNDMIIDILTDNDSSNEDKKASLQVELEKNIVKANPTLFGEGPGAPDLDPINSSEYKDVLYQYVMHVTNDADVSGIAIPQDLKYIIRPIYLTGEQTITLKRKLVEVFNRHHWAGTTITQTTLDTRSADSSEDATDKDLLPFLIPDVAFKMATDDDDTKLEEKALRAKYISLLNAYIVNNISLKHGNPLPDTIISKMTNLRRNTSMKKMIDTYFTKVNFLVMFMIIGYAYYVYHNLYRNQPEGTIQKVSLLAFVLLVLLGFAGWFTKELWI